MAKEIEQEIAELLIRNHMTVTTAESCTGGLVAGRLINAAGISAATGKAILPMRMRQSISCSA